MMINYLFSNAALKALETRNIKKETFFGSPRNKWLTGGEVHYPRYRSVSLAKKPNEKYLATGGFCFQDPLGLHLLVDYNESMKLVCLKATSPIRKGSCVGEWTGCVMDNYNYQKLIRKKKEKRATDRCTDLHNWSVMLPDGYHIVSDVVGSGLQLINHRCLDNNCQIVGTANKDGDLIAALVATRDIQISEKSTCNYGYCLDAKINDETHMTECKCCDYKHLHYVELGGMY